MNCFVILLSFPATNMFRGRTGRDRALHLALGASLLIIQAVAILAPIGSAYFRNLYTTLRAGEYPCPSCGRTSTPHAYTIGLGTTKPSYWNFCDRHAPQRLSRSDLIQCIPGLLPIIVIACYAASIHATIEFLSGKRSIANAILASMGTLLLGIFLANVWIP